jgi:hypothetical protein
MKTKTIYETIDGKHFESYNEAVKHELCLIKDLLHADLPEIDCPDCPFDRACKELTGDGICHLIRRG